VQTVQVVHKDLRHLKRSRVAFQTRFEATSCPPARSGDPAYPRGRTQSKSATSSSTSDGNPQPPARSDYLLPFASLQRECDSSVMRDSIPKTSRSSRGCVAARVRFEHDTKFDPQDIQELPPPLGPDEGCGPPRGTSRGSCSRGGPSTLNPNERTVEQPPPL
jgi:hypothetical protein